MIDEDVQSRKVREYKMKSRGDARSYKTDIEDLCILLSWLNGDLSEGQVSKALGLSRIQAREKMDAAIAYGGEFGEALWRKARG